MTQSFYGSLSSAAGGASAHAGSHLVANAGVSAAPYDSSSPRGRSIARDAPEVHHDFSMHGGRDFERRNDSRRSDRAISAPPLRRGDITIGAPDDDAEKARLVEQIKRLQRTSVEIKELWWNFCDRRHPVFRDPARHSVDVLNEFLNARLPEALAHDGREHTHAARTGAPVQRTTGGADPWANFDGGRVVGLGADAGAGFGKSSSSGAVRRSSSVAAGEDRQYGKVNESTDAWAEFKLKAEERGGIPLAVPVLPKTVAPKAPQLQTGHIPVLLKETLDALFAPGIVGLYVDGTFGRGGHSTEILKRMPAGSRLVAFDVDPSAIAVGRELERRDSRFKIVHRPFGDIGEVLAGEVLAGAMIDIGFSSPQVDQQHRGFSVVDDGPMDLRMNPSRGIPISEWLQTCKPEELAWIIREWGEDDDPIMPSRIAEILLERQRVDGPYKSTLDAADEIRKAKLGMDDRGQHPAKLAFQAMRVFVNTEMEQLRSFMDGSLPLLAPGARTVIITFKRPEASMVKQFVREHEEPSPMLEKVLPPERLADLYPLLRTTKPFAVRMPCPPVTPSASEVALNRRSRSAMVHALESVERSAKWPSPSEFGPAASLGDLFKRPCAARPRRGQAQALASFPPRTSGSCTATILGST
eukprot:TRINITY_DN76555_c0_g1_i1.p1 TRINITY_DN76555_c0_g1~~TRINITY_DN76555_c0_g1_i1.p1  ORF type:complete len:640 (-),score=115.71 TRINITY_DN76555_c0_g1_i1:84-2003(-)